MLWQDMEVLRSFCTGFGTSQPHFAEHLSIQRLDVLCIQLSNSWWTCYNVCCSFIIDLSYFVSILLHSSLSCTLFISWLLLAIPLISGQGYIWMTHKTPGSDRWELSMRSKQLWGLLADSIQTQGMDPSQVLGWKKTGISWFSILCFSISLACRSCGLQKCVL